VSEDGQVAIPNTVAQTDGSPTPNVFVCMVGLDHRRFPGPRCGWEQDVSGLDQEQRAKVARDHSRTHAPQRMKP